MIEPQSLPFSEDAEKCYLCCLCLSKDDLETFAPLLPIEAFYIPAHQIVMRGLLEILEKRLSLDFVILKHVLKTAGDFEEVGGLEGLNSIWSYLHFAAGTQTHFDSVKSYHQARVTILESMKLIQDLRNPKNVVADTVQQYVESVLTKISIGSKVEEKSFRDMVMDAQDDLTRRGENKKISGITFGIEDLDSEIYGVQPGEKCVIAAETGGGKSALASQALIQNSLSGKATGVFSLEMSPTSLIHRMYASVGNVSMSSMKRGMYKEYELQNVERAYTQLLDFRIFIDPARDIGSILSRCRYFKNKYDINLVIVDYVQLVGSKFTNNQERHERLVADVIHKLSDIAGEMDVVVIAMSQLNDDGYLRDSRAIGHDADIVLKIESTEEDEKSKFIHICKQRNGEQGKRIPVTFDGQYMKFSHRDYTPPPTRPTPTYRKSNKNRDWTK